MEVLVLDGKDYVKASKAARDLGYATDYVGQLCRSGQVDAHLIGRTWYVNKDMLGSHKVEKKRISRVKAREHAKKALEEHRSRIQTAKNALESVQIRYESDDSSLLPESKKLSISVEHEPRFQKDLYTDEGPDKDVINEGNTIQMSGNLDVLDASEDALDTDTVLLTPKFNKSSTSKLVSKQEEVYHDTESEADALAPQTTFIEKLHQQQASIENTTQNNGQIDLVELKQSKIEVNKPAVGVCVFFISVVLVGAVSSLFLDQRTTYTNDTLAQKYKLQFSYEKTITIIRSKI